MIFSLGELSLLISPLLFIKGDFTLHPYIKIGEFHNLSISISSYKLFFALACIAVLTISYVCISKRNLPLKKSLLLLFALTLAVPMGARLLHLLTNPIIYQQNPAKLWSFNLAGFALMGGLISAGLVGIILARLLKYDIWPLTDVLAPALGIGLAIMRIGCYLNGCCFGKPTNLPWGIKFPLGSNPHKYYLANIVDKKSLSFLDLISSPKIHPTQLYELLAALIITLIVIYLIKKRTPPGVPFLIFTLLFSLFRWFNSYLRVPAPTLTVIPSFYPLLYLSISILALILIIFRYRQKEPSKY